MSLYALAGKRLSQDSVFETMLEEPCSLDESDMACGQIFFSNSSRYLKFQCELCGYAFINISSFCGHLNDHITDCASDDLLEKGEDVSEQLEDEAESMPARSIKIEDSNKGAEEEVDVSAAVVDEIDEAAEILAEIKDEMMEYEQEDFTVERDDCEDFTDGEEDMLPAQFDPVENPSGTRAGVLSFQDCFEKASVLKETSKESEVDEQCPPDSETTLPLSPSPPRPPAPKRKRVTTVKIIASKNKIAELYKLIELKEKRQTEKLLTDLGITTKEMHTSDDKKANDTEPPRRPRIVHKVVGETLITHIPKSHAQPAADKYSCPACGQVFNTSFSLSIHKRSHYLDTDNRIKLAHKCSDCNKLFNKLSEMKDHIVEVHYPDGFQCKICTKKLTSLTLLEGHIERVHLNRPFNCKICNKNFDDSELYDAHVASHEGAKIFKCHICGRKYSAEKMLKLHLERHKEQIPQCCVVCGKMTLRIAQHMKIHTPRPKRVLCCSICSKTFNHSSGLSQHFKLWHKNAQTMHKAARRRRSVRNAKFTECPIEEQLEDVNEKEEEAKRVIVEMIQSADYNCYNVDNGHDVIPPIAREETISAVNSIVSD